MSKSIQLQQLFQKWRTNWSEDVVFYEDGVINEEEFDKNDHGKKVLFIAKEPNASNHSETNGKMSFIEEWNTTTPTYPFACRIAEWAYGILNDFPEFDDVPKDGKMEYLKKISFMNIKKSGGKGEVESNNSIYQFAKTNKELILEQIEIIDPDLIILSISSDDKIKKLLFGEQVNWQSSGYSLKVASWNGKKIIDFYHPSSRNAAPAAYSLLKCICNRDTFKNL